MPGPGVAYGCTPWKKVGSVAALPLPMECVLDNFGSGQRISFAVQAVDSTTRTGPFSDTKSIYV